MAVVTPATMKVAVAEDDMVMVEKVTADKALAAVVESEAAVVDDETAATYEKAAMVDEEEAAAYEK